MPAGVSTSLALINVLMFPMRSATGSNVTATGLIVRISERNTMREPSFERLGLSAVECTPLVTDSGLPSVRPDASSMATRHRFIDPPRSLAKYKCCPSVDHVGLQSIG